MTFLSKSLVDIYGSETKDGPAYTLVYNVRTTGGEGPLAVRSYVGWNYGDPYSYGSETDLLAIATSIQEKPTGTSRKDWTVTVEFTRPAKEDSSEDSENPLLDPIGIDWDFEERQIVTERDASGNWIKNSASDRYDEIITTDDFRRTLIITRNEATFPKALADALSNRLNVAVWNGYPAKFVKLKPIRASRAYNQAIGLYYVVRYEFHFAPIGGDWKRYILDAGLNEVVSGTKKANDARQQANRRSPCPQWKRRQARSCGNARLYWLGTALYRRL